MQIIPFRIIPSENEEDYSDVYEFLIKGNTKNAYQIKIYIDSLNDLGITFETCICPHFKFRKQECKHIKACKTILKEFKIIDGK